MAINDIKQKMQGWMQKLTTRREGEQKPLSNMPNGSVSGYQPKIPPRRRPEAEGPEAHPAAAFSGMTPAGVDPAGMPQFIPPLQPTQAQPMQGQPVQGNTMRGQFQGMQPPQQPYGNQASSQPMPPPQQPMQPLMQDTGYQPRHQGPVQGAWVQPQFAQQPVQPQTMQGQPAPQPVQPPVQPQPAPAEKNVHYFPGTVVDEMGNPYSMVLRVAQITGISSCYRLLEFMQNNEAVIVNAEQITDVMEANRCMDMLFGAAYAMNQTFERIAGKLIYLIAPRHVHVLPFESMLHLSQQDVERRWPGSSRAGQDYRRASGARQEDFAPAFGQRAAAPQPGQYTDYSGFGGFRSRR